MSAAAMPRPATSAYDSDLSGDVADNPWTAEEHRQLEEGLRMYPEPEYSAVERYVKVAAALPNKTVHDVTLRVKWMALQEAKKRRAAEEGGGNRAKAGRQLPGAAPAASAAAVMPPPSLPLPLIQQPNGGAAAQQSNLWSQVQPQQAGAGPSSSVGAMQVAPGAGGSGVHAGGAARAPALRQAQPAPGLSSGADAKVPGAAAGGAPGPGVGPSFGVGPGRGGGASSAEALLEQNYGLLNQLRSNMAAFRVMENTELLMRFRDNLVALLAQLEGGGGGGAGGAATVAATSALPKLPVRPNLDLAAKLFPPAHLVSAMAPSAGTAMPFAPLSGLPPLIGPPLMPLPGGVMGPPQGPLPFGMPPLPAATGAAAAAPGASGAPGAPIAATLGMMLPLGLAGLIGAPSPQLAAAAMQAGFMQPIAAAASTGVAGLKAGGGGGSGSGGAVVASMGPPATSLTALQQQQRAAVPNSGGGGVKQL